jgi:hypothetical protein
LFVSGDFTEYVLELVKRTPALTELDLEGSSVVGVFATRLLDEQPLLASSLTVLHLPDWAPKIDDLPLLRRCVSLTRLSIGVLPRCPASGACLRALPALRELHVKDGSSVQDLLSQLPVLGLRKLVCQNGFVVTERSVRSLARVMPELRLLQALQVTSRHILARLLQAMPLLQVLRLKAGCHSDVMRSYCVYT